MFTVDFAGNNRFAVPAPDAVRAFLVGLLLGTGETSEEAGNIADAWSEELSEYGAIDYVLADGTRLYVEKDGR